MGKEGNRQREEEVAKERNRVKTSCKRLQATNYKNVELRDSRFLRQFEQTKEMYAEIPNDSLLYNFRKRAGKAAPGHPLTGWYGRQSFNFGQFCGALAKMYAQTGEARLKHKLYYLLNEWGMCIDEEGYGFSPEKKRYREYIMAYEYEKLVGGLTDAWEYAGYPRAFEWLKKITLWYEQHSPCGDREKLYLVEWYTLSENLYRAYLLSGDEIYYRVAKSHEYPEYWNVFLKPPIRLKRPKHAYSHVNSLSGAAMAYAVERKEIYLKILERAYEEITQRHIYATGGYGPSEDMFGQAGYLGDSLKSAWDRTVTEARLRPRHDAQGNCEVSCCTWAAMKLCRYLMEYTGEARYGDWMEKVLYNGVLALPLVTPEGKIMYYANYFLDGGIKSTLDRRYHGAVEAYDDLSVTYHYNWQCCTGTYPQVTAEYANLIYYRNGREICISQYLPSVYRFSLLESIEEKLHATESEEYSGDWGMLECETEYPEREEILYRLTLPEGREEQLALKFRIPSWCTEQVQVYVNGEPQEHQASAGQWLELKRGWHSGDVIALYIKRELYFRAIDEKNPKIAALCWGPAVMVTDDLSAYTADMGYPEKWILPAEDGKMELHTKEGSMEGMYTFETRTYTPFYDWPEGKWYFMYAWFV